MSNPCGSGPRNGGGPKGTPPDKPPLLLLSILVLVSGSIFILDLVSFLAASNPLLQTFYLCL